MVIKSLSLVELKKQQWAKEKEELVKLNGYWRNRDNPTVVFNDQRDHVFYPGIRANNKDHLNAYKDAQPQKNLGFPPISQDNQKQNKNNNMYNNIMEKLENNDDRSGAMDDSEPKSTHTILNRTYTISKENNASKGGTVERQMWDKQYVTNTGLNSPNISPNDKKSLTNESNKMPTWVECALEEDFTINEIGRTQFEDTLSRKAQDFKGSCDTLSSLDSNNINNRTYLLGQNIPLTNEELAARELKRQKAMELQEAIKQQLKERQLKKQDELERKRQDDLAEERRIQRQQEIEKRRIEDELKRQREKELSDERKAKAMQEVLENAQKQAKEDKSKSMHKKRHNPDGIKAENIQETDAVNDDGPEQKTNSEQKKSAEQKTSVEQNSVSYESKPKQSVPAETVTSELKEDSKLPEVDVTQQTSPSPLNRQKLLTPSKFRNQIFTSVAIQTEMSNKPKTAVGSVYQKSIDLDKRPKWGVNRPEVQYVKQSAKDPNYQSKLRQNSSWNRRKSTAESAKSQPDTIARNSFTLPDSYSKKMSAYGRPNFAEMKNDKNNQNKIPKSLDSISVSDVLYQLSSLRKVLETKRKHWRSVIADESPSSDSS